MKRRQRVVWLCLFLFLLGTRIPARAGFYVGLQAGRSSQDVSAGKTDLMSDSSVLYGGQAGIRFLSFALEGEYFRAGHRLVSGSASFPDLSQGMDYSYLGIKGKLGIPLVVVFPYVLVGYGTYSVSLEASGKESASALSLGAGAEAKLGKIGLFAELRYADFDLNLDSLDWDFGGVNVHAGLNLHF